MRQIIPIKAPCLNLCTRSGPFRVHSLPTGRLPSSRCIRSAPQEHLDSTTCHEMDASDTALRLPGTNLRSRALGLPFATLWG